MQAFPRQQDVFGRQTENAPSVPEKHERGI